MHLQNAVQIDDAGTPQTFYGPHLILAQPPTAACTLPRISRSLAQVQTNNAAQLATATGVTSSPNQQNRPASRRPGQRQEGRSTLRNSGGGREASLLRRASGSGEP